MPCPLSYSFNTSPRRPRPADCSRHVLAVATGGDGVRLLLLAEHAGTGVISMSRAQCWSASAAAGEIAAAVGVAYRTATRQGPTSVHAVHTQPGGLWPALIRRALGPLANITVHTAVPSPVGWPASCSAS
jgi:hypothetical protein